MSVAGVVVECSVVGVEVCKDVCRNVVVEKGVYVCVRDVCVGSCVCSGHQYWSVFCVYFCRQEVPKSPLGDKFMPCSVFNENSNAVILCFCSVACSVSVVFDW